MTNEFRHRPHGKLSRFKSAKIEKASAYVTLAEDHPAVVEGRTIFPKTVVGSMDSPRLLVSGRNNPKLGDHVTKGDRAGWPIYQLTLEERATCPRSCAMWRGCYGGGMHMARRHRVDAAFFPLLRSELTLLAREHPAGFLVRLHTLGDFPSTEYVQFWADMLDDLPALHIFGFTARSMDDDDLESQRIAKAITWLANEAWDRFSIRFSRGWAVPQGAVVLEEPSQRPQVIMCPAQTEATTACATCGLCWAPSARQKTIGFLRHGQKRSNTADPESRPVKRGPKPGARANVPARRRKILAVLRRAADHDGYVTMTLNSMAREAGVTTSTIRSDLDALISEKHVIDEHPGHGQVPSTYQLDLASCDATLNVAVVEPPPEEPTPAYLVSARSRLAAFDPILK